MTLIYQSIGRTLFWFSEEFAQELPLTEFQPVNAIPTVKLIPGAVPCAKFQFTKSTSVYMVKRSPRWAPFE